jgi:hypothetical protein
MKTTLQIPDDLMRDIKVRAAQEGRRLTDVITELLRRGMNAEKPPSKSRQHRVKFPLITGTHPAAPGEEITPKRVFEILMEEEVERARGA